MRGDAARQIAQVGMIADTGILRQVGRDDLLHPGDLRLRQQIEVRAALHGGLAAAAAEDEVDGRQHLLLRQHRDQLFRVHLHLPRMHVRAGLGPEARPLVGPAQLLEQG